MYLRAIVLFTILAAIAGCGPGGGSSPSAPPRTVVIQGVVSDDAVVGATVVVTSLADGTVLATVPSTSGGAFSTPAILESQLASGWQVSATGGVMGGTTFVGTLRGAYGSTSDYLRSHATLYTTALVRAAESEGVAAGQLVARTASIAAAAVQRAVLPSDWSDPYSSSPALSSVRLAIQVGESVDAVTTRLGAEMTYRPSLSVSGATVCSVIDGAGMTICSARIGSAEGTVTDPSHTNTIVAVPAGAVPSGCYRDFHAQISRDGTSMKLVWSDPEALPCAGPLLSPVTLILPALRTDGSQLPQVPDACPTAANLGHAAMRECRTTSGPTGQIMPGVFVSDVSTYRVGAGWMADGTRDPALATAHQTKTLGATIEYRYGAMLSRATAGGNLNAVPVLLIHGYSPAVVNPVSFGGDDGTWGSLPNLIFGLRPPIDRSAAWFEPYNFQWRTNTSFLDAADDLANAIHKAYAETGNRRVHIVAHSFGGILARVVLQRPSWGTNIANPNWTAAAEKVASLTTVGTPHSGINDSGGDLFVEARSGVALPIGWAPYRLSTLCGQLSCYEAGGRPTVEDWAIRQLRRGSSVPVGGYIVAALAKITNSNPLPANLVVQVLIGQQRNIIEVPGIAITFQDGDNLIAYAGQRFTPTVGAVANSSALLFNESGPEALGAKLLSERVLGLGARATAPPGTLAAPLLFNSAGYAHTSALGLEVFSPEVEIPSSCAAVEGTGLGCQHETWVYVKSLLDWMTGGAAALNFPAAMVQSASCTAPVAGVAMQCTISGSNLPTTIAMSATNCAPTAMSVVAGGSDTARQFTCTPTTVGAVVTVTYNVPGYTGTLPNLAPVATAANPNNRAPTASFTVSLASALVGQAVTFDPAASADPDGSISTYLWSYGDGQTALVASNSAVSHSYAAIGSYTVTLTVTDNLGATGNATRTVVISSFPTSWDAVADFSVTPNLNSAWKYSVDTASTAPVLMATPTINCSSIPLPCWKVGSTAVDLPLIAANTTGSTVTHTTVVVPARMLLLHPGFTASDVSGGAPLGPSQVAGQRPVVSWTAPADGNYLVSGRFQGADTIPSGVNVIVKRDATVVNTQSIAGYGAVAPFSFVSNFLAGQVVSFTVDGGLTAANDSTVLAVTITKQ